MVAVAVAAVAAVVLAAEPAREVAAAAVAVLAAVLAAGVVSAAGAEAADRLDDGALGSRAWPSGRGRPGAFGGPAATGTIAPCRRVRHRTMTAA